MPLTGPRPNPNPSNIRPTSYDNNVAAASQHSIPSFSSLDGRPAFPNSLNSSQLPYPHQSSPESGTAQLEPLPLDRRSDGLTGAQSVMRDYQTSRGYNAGDIAGDDGDVGLLASRPRSRYGDGYSHEYAYDNPYENEHENETPPEYHQERALTSSPSLGPWDSASQRSLPYHPSYPLPGPTHVPLSAGNGGSSRRGYGSHIDKKPSHGGLSYIDEDGEYYHSDQARPASTHLARDMHDDDGVELGLVDGDEEQERYRNVKFADYQESPYPYPPSQKSSSIPSAQPNHLYSMLLFPTGLDRLLALFGVKTGAYPVEQAIERKKRGLGGQRWPVAAWGLAAAMTGIMVYELIANYQAMGTPIAIHPSFNYMIGPSSEVLINVGARFPPCMKYVEALPPTFELACLNDTSSTPTTACSIEEICGHGGFPSGTPDQSWRFVYPIFLHVGLIHLALNMVAQVTAGAQVEREMGTIPFLLVYMAGGIYGFVLGGNFTRTGIPSVGASGALFATNACVLVDLILHWKYEERPKLKAFLLALEFLIGFAIGYIPNAVDGLAHLGGWAMGILMGIILYPSISETRRHRLIVWGCRVVALVLIILAFVLTLKNFYTADPNAACEWCRYLSCIPTSSNDHCTGTGVTVTNTTSTKRSWDLL